MAFPANIFQQFTSDTTSWRPGNALALGWAADLAYESDQTVKDVSAGWDLKAPVIIQGASNTQAFVTGNASAVLVVFRGTISEKDGKLDPNNWIVDLDA